MKIKTKKQLNLPQLIEYIWDNDIKNEFFRRLNRGPFEYVWVNEDSNIEFDDNILFRKNDIFEIEVEEEIDEDTHLDYLYMLTDTKDVLRCNYRTIKVATKAFKSYDFTFFTLVDNDLVKIYENGKMVE